MTLLSWMPLYLYSRFHLSLSMAAFDAAIFPQLASIGGAVCGGFMADKLASISSRGRVLMQSAGVFFGAPFVVLCGLGRSLTLVIAALVFWGFFKGIYDSNIFASAFDVVPVESRGTVSGLMNCVGWLLGGGIAPAVIGYLATRFALGTAIALSATLSVLAGSLLAFIARRTLVAEIQRMHY